MRTASGLPGRLDDRGKVNPQNWRKDDPDAAFALGTQSGTSSQGHAENLVPGPVTGWDVQDRRIHSPDGIGPTLNAQKGGGQRGTAHVQAVASEGDDEAYDPLPDGPRYAAMGNAVSVPVAHWIGERIVAYERGDLK